MGVDRDLRDWQELAELDPYWAALTEGSKRAGGWDERDFARSGTEEVERLLAHTETLGAPARLAAALDFGCGPGRLTRALAEHFERVVGIDLSERMVERARHLNRSVENVRFHAGADALSVLDDRAFDLVYSNLVLQHVSDSAAVLRYVGEFVRVLVPGGLLAFQIPSHVPPLRRLQPRRRLYHALRFAGTPATLLYRRLRLDPVGLYAVPRVQVELTLERVGARTIRIDEEEWPSGIRSSTYFVTR